MKMFCYQCEQTAEGKGCSVHGVCGKSPEVAALQDLLIYAVKGISMYAHRARLLDVKDNEIDAFVPYALFYTITNVNFDLEDIREKINEAAKLRDRAKGLYHEACSKNGRSPEKLAGPAAWQSASDREGLLKQAKEIGIESRMEKSGPDVTGLEELLTYGLKGAGAYTYHAKLLGKEDEAIYEFNHRALDYLAGKDRTVDELFAMCLEAGANNIRAMEILDKANTGAYGHPVPTPVRIEPVKGKAILISGHDFLDLEELLKQTEGKGINIYTHGEMLTAHGYPKLKKYKHLVGNYGGAWQEQRTEFEAFPGAILMTTNCLMRPKNSYRERLFTSGPVGFPGVRHIEGHDFAPLIEAAQNAQGFKEDGSERSITVGFAHEAVMGVADKVIEAVKEGKIRHFFLIGGCDGAKPGRNYYTQFAQAVPKDCVILTLACGKYRFNKLDFGDIGGIPRLLDVGQCNDAYSAVQIALALAKAFNTDVNSLPLSFIISWYEQKAVGILLSLLHLGVKNMRLGPTLPAFVTPAVLKVLVEKFNIIPISTPEEDLKAILG